MTKLPTDANDKLFWIAAAAIVVFVYFFGLNIPLLGPDEPRYAQVAREMFERGDWVTPTLGGHNWFEKPALLYWLQIASFSLFGVSEFAARFGSALFGLGTIAAMWFLGRTFGEDFARSGHESRFSPIRVANWFALIAASTLGLIVFARGGSFDIILTFPIAAAMISFFVFDSHVRRRSSAPSRFLPLFLFYFFIGVALLAKGLVGAVFPIGIVTFYHIISRRLPGRQVLLSLIWGPILAALVASTWYVPMYLQNGWEFIDEFFIQHHFQRYTSNKYLHPQPFHFFFWVLPLMTIPWLPFFFAAVWRFGKRVFNRGDAETRRMEEVYSEPKADRSGLQPQPVDEDAQTPLLLFAASWLLVPLLFFSFSGSKLPGYIMPAVPAATAITAVYVLGLMRRKPVAERWLKGLVVATFVVVVGIIIFVLPKFADMDSVKGLIADANSRGYGNDTVLTLHTVSHNAEFYAPGRLLRDEDGKQKRLNGPAEVLAEARKSSTGGVLVITPIEHRKQLEESQLFNSEIIRDNGEYLIAHVRPK